MTVNLSNGSVPFHNFKPKMPLLRSQYQGVKAGLEFAQAKGSGSVSQNRNSTHQTARLYYHQQQNGGMSISLSSSDDDKSITSSSSTAPRNELGEKSKKDYKSRKNGGRFNQRRSLRRSNESISSQNDELNVATVHSSPPSSDYPLVYSQSNMGLGMGGSCSETHSFDAFMTHAAEVNGRQMYQTPYTMLDVPGAHFHPHYGINLGIARLPGIDPHKNNFDTSRWDRELRDILDEHGCYESEEGNVRRNNIVSSLDSLCKRITRQIGLNFLAPQQSYADLTEEMGDSKVLTYGSCKLQAADMEADMDLICIAPQFVERHDFFQNIYAELENLEQVKELRQLPEAYVPVIKFSYDSIEIDLTFASLFKKVPDSEDDFLDEKITYGLDDRCLRSLNGYRATCEILQLVPDTSVFQQCLRAVKLWAKQNGIYSNILGYLGGASWAILVARACQEQYKSEGNEIHTPTRVLMTFFNFYSIWQWPNPIYIRRVEKQPESAWNPNLRYPDKDHTMPIITSSVPQMNSAVNVTTSNRKIIVEKIKRADKICRDIKANRYDWSALFHPPTFFEEFDNFIVITGSSDRDVGFWFGNVESKLRHLKDKIDRECRVSSRLFPKGFLLKEMENTKQTWFLGLSNQAEVSTKLTDVLECFRGLCLGDVKKRVLTSNTYDNSMTQFGYDVVYEFIHRSNLHRFVNYTTEMGLNRKKKPTYASVTQGTTSRVATPPVVAPPVVSMPMTSAAPLLVNSYQGFHAGNLINNMAYLPSNGYQMYQTERARSPVPQVVSRPDDTSSPLLLMGGGGSGAGGLLQGSPLTTSLPSSPVGFSRNNNSPSYQNNRNNSPSYQNHAMSPRYFKDGLSRAPVYCNSPLQAHHVHNGYINPTTLVSHCVPLPPLPSNPPNLINHNAVSHQPQSNPHLVHPTGIPSPSIFVTQPFSPVRPGMFPHFNVPPPGVDALGSAYIGSPSNAPSPSPKPDGQGANPPIKRTIPHAFVTGVNNLNSVHHNYKGRDRPDCSCSSSVSDSENFSPSILSAIKKVNLSETDDRLRSVSYSSDTVPPKSLWRSRIDHQDAPPPSPFKQTSCGPISPGIVPSLSQVDVSLPPPYSRIINNGNNFQDPPPRTFSSIHKRERGVKARPHMSPRHSVSEIPDVCTPRPVSHHLNQEIKVNICVDEVFKT